MKEFLKELTELSLKHKLIIHGDGVYCHIVLTKCLDDLKGQYIKSYDDEDDTAFEWKDFMNGL